MSEIPHIGKLIKKKLKEQERTIAWLAKKIEYDRSNLHKFLQQPDIPLYLLRKISSILKHDFFKSYSLSLQIHDTEYTNTVACSCGENNLKTL